MNRRQAVVYLEGAELDQPVPFLLELPGTVVVDHMGRPDVASGVDDAGFGGFASSWPTTPTARR